MATDPVLGVDTSCPYADSQNVAPSPGSGSVVSPMIHSFSKHDTIKLTEANFLLWKHQLLFILEGYDLEGFVQGTLPIPSPLVAGVDGQLIDNPLFLAHKKQDKFLASWLLSTVSDEVLVHLTTAKTSFDIWSTIEKRFGAKSNLKVSRMRHDLCSLKKANLTVKEYLAKVKRLSDSLATAGSVVTEQEQVIIILAGLSLEFESIHVIASASPMSLDLLTKMLLDCEARRIELLADVPMQANVSSYSKNSYHSKNNGDSNGYTQVFRQDSRGHDRSWSRGRYRGNARGWSRFKPQCQLCVPPPSRSSSDSSAQAWYPNSGATNHITPDVTNLLTVSPYTGTDQVSMGNGEHVSIAHVGFSSMLAGSRVLHLKNVLYVPTVCKNLLSVGQFARDNSVYFEFHPYMCFMKDIQTGMILLVAHMHKGLYRFDVSQDGSSKMVLPNSMSVYQAQISSTPLLWHKRLGHPCNNTLVRVLKNCNVSFQHNGLPSVCAACQLGKSHRLPFSASKIVYSIPFELVVSDVWGPAHVKSNGFCYYVSFVDMYSRYTWLYFIKVKSEVLNCFLHFQQIIQAQFGYSIKLLQTDWRGEYRSLSTELFKRGIQHRITCPHTSEQNGVAERRHRQVVDMGLTLLAQASMPLEFWSSSFSHAVHVINRLPTPVLQGISPYEKLYKELPDYSHLRVFGYAYFPYLRPYNQHKLQFSSKCCTFLGFGPNHKGYKCLDDTSRVFVSRHVVFDETQFPFQQGCSSRNLVCPKEQPHQQSHIPVVTAPASNSHFGSEAGPTTSSSIAPPTSVPSNHGSHVDRVSSSPLASESSPSFSPIRPAVNNHPMQTQSKCGIYKPKVFSSVVAVKEPASIHEAFQSPEWLAAAQAEYQALLANHTWDLMPLPAGRRAVGCKWIFKVKKNADGSIA
ncbi:hypothetical protein CXB51_009599 [Gossypium anomalum]|uniref:Integrase catalytic domain-containing protein n=1 Tax=Gossypium anomalum TaxID=47600 RepID=A0A8J5YLS0_9ROSI|nr:hypothetical protein CXB51_009599 [Gossypium anomalum]